MTKPVETPVLIAHLRSLLRVARAEARARAGEERFRAVIEHGFDGVSLAAPDGTLSYVSPAGAAMLGWPAGDARGRTVCDGVHPDDAPAVRAAFDRALATPGVPADTIHRVGHPDRGWRWVEARQTNLLGNAAVGAVVTHFRDVTGRREAEIAQARLAAIVDSSDSAIVSTDRGWVVESWNPAAERLFGYAAAEMVGRSILDLVPPDQHAEARAVVERVRAGARVAPFDAVRVRKDGRPVHVSVNPWPIRDAAGEFISLAAVYTDRTDRRRMEEQLRQSQKMDAVGRLAGGVAHDFNNLLTVINGYGQMVQADLPAGHPSQEMMAEVVRAGERAADLTRQLLTFSRQAVVAPRVLDLNAVVADAERMLRRVIGEDVALTVRLQPGLGAVRADPGQLEQVVVNLAVNARDAMPTGGRITIETRDIDLGGEYAFGHVGVPPGPYVLLAVADTGVGMPAEVQARLWEPFFTTKEAGSGTGLGLAIVHGVVRQCGGHAEVYSEVGHGTTFKLYFPRAVGATGAAAARPAGSLPRGSETVLLAEDESGVRAIIRRVLEGCGYTVLETANGDDALRRAADHAGRVDLLVTDVVMPKVSGRMLAEQLAAARPGLKVLYLSGYTDDAVVRHGILEERVNFLQKPFAPAALARKVREVLDGP